MKYLTILILMLGGHLFAGQGEWERQVLLPEFYGEGCGVGDLNGDGLVDLTYGPFWFAGPDFKRVSRFTKGEAFQAERGYSNSFFSFVDDFNGDGKNDLIVFGFPGKEARIYLNSGDESLWNEFVVAKEVANESPHFVDLVPGGFPEIVCARSGSYGYYEAANDATKPWVWHSISLPGDAVTPFGHGLGVGDLNGDGRNDVIEKTHWYEQPKKLGGLWEKHIWSASNYGGGGAQILIEDFDQDGDADIVTSYQAHGYGLGWFEQVEAGKFRRRDLMGKSSTEGDFGVVFSQLHALTKVDMDRDGRMDFVTGKRYLAHQGKDVGGLQAPVLYWFRNTATNDGLEFVPHLIDGDSGVGVEVKVADLNADGLPDVITSNKKGLITHLQKKGVARSPTPKWKVAGGRPQDGYQHKMSARESLARMEVPEGFSVDLIAAEPEVAQPIAMCFDERGRIWLVEGHTYPVRAKEGEGKDRIVILEDADQDGSFETKKIFAEGINLASGIEVGFGGVYVGAAPYLIFYPDKNRDDVPDGEPEILLDGWGYQDTHETLNSFTWGPDGWLYGCHGVFTHSKVGKPGAPDSEREKLNAGVWRFHPVSRKFEVYAHGTSNPWGVDYNEVGDWFVSACVIPHFYHIFQGGRYQRQAGQHFNQHTYEDIKTIADHSHFAGNIQEHAFWGGNFTERRPAPSDTSALGGGHAHCGLAIYQADEFPGEYRGTPFFHNLHGHRIVREKLEREGSGYLARHRPDFLLTNNHDFIGVGLMQGPDGAMYFSDWVDPQTCHHRDVKIWDRSNGRIFRIRHGEAKSPAMNLWEASDRELAGMVADPNEVRSRLARRVLHERSRNETLDANVVEPILTKFQQSSETRIRLRGYWARTLSGLMTPELLLETLSDKDPHVRAWAVQSLDEWITPEFEIRLSEMARNDESLIVRRQLASLLQRLNHDDRWKIAEGLVAHPISGMDKNIPLLCWYGIEPLVDVDPARALALGDNAAWPQLKQFLIRRATGTPEGRLAMTRSLSEAKSVGAFETLAKQLLESLKNVSSFQKPANWEEIKINGRKLGGDQKIIEGLLAELGGPFEDSDFFPYWRAVAEDGKQAAFARNRAMEFLINGKDPGLASLARDLLHVGSMQEVAIKALRQHPGGPTAEALVKHLAGFPLKLRNDAVNLLASRGDMALILLQAVDQKKVSSSLVSMVLLQQFDRFNHEEINGLISKNWSRSGAAVDLANLSGEIKKWEEKLNPIVVSKANASRGRAVFTATCGACHQLFGEGIALGPDLTGSNRANLSYLLENVLAPSSVVGKDYLLNVFTLKDGSTLSGMVRRETDHVIELAMPGGTVTGVKKGDVQSREELAQSLMPAGLFDALPVEQVADLVKYLGSSSQVPLPGEGPEIPDPTQKVGPPAIGVIRFEGESLVKTAKVNRGEVIDQSMKSFGPGWSGDNHLWWTGGKPGDVLTMTLKGLKPGTYDLTLYPTTARDYAMIKVSMNGQLQEADLYTKAVLPGIPLIFRKVNVSPGEPLQVDVHIAGKNESADPAFMVGIDRLEVMKAKR